MVEFGDKNHHARSMRGDRDARLHADRFGKAPEACLTGGEPGALCAPFDALKKHAQLGVAMLVGM
jgi:hypothetical protein